MKLDHLVGLVNNQEEGKCDRCNKWYRGRSVKDKLFSKIILLN
jgi:hypothetical protein